MAEDVHIKVMVRSPAYLEGRLQSHAAWIHSLTRHVSTDQGWLLVYSAASSQVHTITYIRGSGVRYEGAGGEVRLQSHAAWTHSLTRHVSTDQGWLLVYSAASSQVQNIT